MKLATTSLLLLALSVEAWVPPVPVRPVSKVSNPILTADELGQLFHLDEAVDMIAHNTQLAWPEVYTSEDRQQLWKTNSLPQWQLQNENTNPLPYTSDDRAELFQLSKQMPVETRIQDHVCYSNSDRAQLWKLQEQSSAIKDPRSSPLPYTSQDRAELWKLGQYNPHRQNHLSFEELAHLWHLDTMTVADKTKSSPYTTEDRELLWHLNEKTVAGDETNNPSPYTSEDREMLWHLENSGNQLHKETKAEIFSSEDRAGLWKLKKTVGGPSKHIKDDPEFVSAEYDP
jgi:hypothetical protein